MFNDMRLILCVLMIGCAPYLSAMQRCMQMVEEKQVVKQKVLCKVLVKTIFDAVRENNHLQVRFMLPYYMSEFQYPNYKDRDNEGRTLLHLAAEYSDAAMVSILLPDLKNLINSVVATQREISSSHWGSLYMRHVVEEVAGETPLMVAVRKGKLDVVKMLVANGAQADILDNGMNSPLHVAADKGYAEIVQVLLSGRASWNVRNHEGKTALELAVIRNDWNTVLRFLTFGGSEINSFQNNNEPPLFLAIKHNSLALVQKILQIDGQKALCQVRDSQGLNAFDYAVLLNYLQIADHILACGGDINARNKNSETIMHQAVAMVKPNSVLYLLKKGAEVNARDSYQTNPLHIAARWNLCEIGRELVTHSADVNAKTMFAKHEGFIALHVAIANKQTEFAKMLLGHPSIKTVSKADLFTALALAVQNGLTEIVEILLRFNVYPNLDKETDSAKLLDDAIARGYYDIVRSLLHVCDAPFIDNLSNKNAALWYAVSHGDFPMATIFLAHHADIHAANQDELTLLDKAVQDAKMESVQFLLNAGAHASIQGGSGQTALHLAARRNLCEIGQELIAHGADVNAKILRGDHAGFIPLHVAISTKQTEFAKMLVGHPSIKTVLADDLFAALVLAVQNGLVDIVEILLRFNVYPNLNKEADTIKLLDNAIALGYYDIVRLLLHECDAPFIDNLRNKNTALGYAVSHGDFPMATIFLAHHADIDAADHDGLTLLDKAVRDAKKESVQFLLNARANASIQGGSGQTALHLAARRNLCEIGQELIARGADVNAKIMQGDHSGFIPLHVSILEHNIPFALMLLENPSIAHVSRGDLFQALVLACQEGLLDIVKILLRFGIYVGAPSDEFKNYPDPFDIAIANRRNNIIREFLERGIMCSPQSFHNAVEMGDLDLVKLFISFGADINVRDRSGRLLLEKKIAKPIRDYLTKVAPYMYQLLEAAATGNVELLRTCAAHGADLNVHDAQGNTPLARAVIQGHARIVQELLCRGADHSLVNHEGLSPQQQAVLLNRADIIALFERAEKSIDIVNRNAVVGQLGRIVDLVGRYDQGLALYRQKKHCLLNISAKLRWVFTGIAGGVSGALIFKRACHASSISGFGGACRASIIPTVGAGLLSCLVYFVSKANIYNFIKKQFAQHDGLRLQSDLELIRQGNQVLVRLVAGRSDQAAAVLKLDNVLDAGASNREALRVNKARNQLRICRDVLVGKDF